MAKISDFPVFDASNHINTPEDVAAYLTVALEDEDPDFILDALSMVARSRGMTQLSRSSGITREALYKALRPGSAPRFATIHSLAKALGLQIIIQPRAAEPVVA